MPTPTTTEQQTTELTTTEPPTTTTETTTSESTSTNKEQSTTLTSQIQTSGTTQSSTSDTSVTSSSSSTTTTSDRLSQDEIILYSIFGSLGFIIVVVLVVVIVCCTLRSRNVKDPAAITQKKKKSPKHIVNDERVKNAPKHLQARIPQKMTSSLATYQPKSLPEGWNKYNGDQRSHSQDKHHRAQNREKKQRNPQYESHKASRLYPSIHMGSTGYDNRAYYPNARVQQRYSPHLANYHTHDSSHNWSYPALHRGYYVQDWLDTNNRSYEANWMY